MSYQALEEYRDFARPAELHKAINTLRGLVAGIRANEVVADNEVQELAHWCSLHETLRKRAPFSEILPLIDEIIADGRIDDEEKADLLWVCDHATGACDFYDDVASSIQYLGGLVHGMLADQTLDDREIHALRAWLNDNEFLAGTYPFDELSSLVNAILCDGAITEDERNTLMGFIGNLVEFKDSYNLREADFAELRKEYSVDGICALAPTVVFSGRIFVVTGESYRGPRSLLTEQITALGGTVKTAVSKKTDYLIVGNAGNPCWAFACYGRKIEQALNLRKQGAKVVIVNETDFWDAAADQ